MNRCGFLILSLMATVLIGSAWAVHGQTTEELTTVKSLWVKGFELFDQAEILAGAGESGVASRRFAEALTHFEEISRRQPDWNPSLVNYRITICRKRMADLADAPATASPDGGRDAAVGTDRGQPGDAPPALQDLDSITVLATENATLKSELAALNQELSRLRGKEQAFTDLALQSTRIDALNRTLRGQVAEAAGRCEKAERERKNALDAQAGFLQKIAELNNALIEARAQNLTLAEAVAQIPSLREKSEQCDRLTELVADLNRQQEEILTELQAKRQLVAEFEKEIPVLREQLAASAQRLDQVEGERKTAAERQAALLPQVADLNLALAEARKQNLALAEEAQGKNLALAEAAAQISVLREQLAASALRLDQVEGERKTAAERQAALLPQVAELNTALAEARKQNLALAEEAQGKNLALAEAAAQILALREKAEQCDRLTELAIGLQRQREEVRTELEARRQTVADLEKELASLREQAAAANPVPVEPATSPEGESVPAIRADPAVPQPELAVPAPAVPAQPGD